MRVRAFHSSVIAQAADSSAPKSLLWMPSGKQSIFASVNDEPTEVEVECSEDDAKRLDEQLQAMLADSNAGKVSRPFVDFDHAGNTAAAIPTQFYWDNGIRLAVEWTKAGSEAVSGRTYSYFSPEFILGDDGHPKAIPSPGPIGGLVNTPAFQNMERLAAKMANNSEGNTSKTPNHTESRMTKLMSALVEEKLIPSAGLDDDGATNLFKASFATIKERESVSAERIKELESAINLLQTQIAEAVIGEQIKAGRIKDDPSLKAKWVAAYLSNADGCKAMLASIPEVKVQVGADPVPTEKKQEKPDGKALRAKLAEITDPIERSVFIQANYATLMSVRGDR